MTSPSEQTQREREYGHHRVNDFCRLHGIGRSKFYELVRAGKLQIVKLDGRTLVPGGQKLPTSLPTSGRRTVADNGAQQCTIQKVKQLITQ